MTMRERAEQAADHIPGIAAASDSTRTEIADAIERVAREERARIVTLLRDLKNQGLVRASAPPGCSWKHWCEAYEDAWRVAALVAEAEKS